MSWSRNGVSLLAIGLLASSLVWQLGFTAVRPSSEPTKIEFRIVESSDARQRGGRPGHIGRIGGLGPVQPDIAVGSPVYRRDGKVGSVTRLAWDRTNEVLEVEFSPEGPIGAVRLPIGEDVWVPLSFNPSNARDR